MAKDAEPRRSYFGVDASGIRIVTFTLDLTPFVVPGDGTTIDWDSVDLDPSTPAIDHTFNPTPESQLTYSPSTRIVSFTGRSPFGNELGGTSSPYVVKDALGQLSNTADIRAIFAVS